MIPTELLDKWKSSAVDFVQDVYGVTPDPWQREALEAITENNRLTIRSGHGVGKTTFLSWLIRWFHVTNEECRIPCTAPSSNQLKNILFAEVAHWMRREPEFLSKQFEFTGDRIVRIDNPKGSFAVARTSRAERPEALAGFHHDNILFVIEEASGVPEQVYETAQGALSTHGAKIVMAGNPTRTQGYFFDSHNEMRELWYTMRVNAETSPRVDSDYLAAQKRIWGEDSNAYRVRVLGDFPTGDDDSVINYAQVLEATQREVDTTDSPVIWGLDPARFGDDRTCLAKRQGNTLLEPIQAWKGKDSGQVAGIMTNLYHETPKHMRPEWIATDVIGIGAGVVDRMKENGLPIKAVNVAESAAIKTKFMRLRDELWWAGREWFEAQNCKIPHDDGFITELTMPHYEITPAGKVLVESKESVKKRTMHSRSPDKADAFLLTFYAKNASADHMKPLVYPKLRVA